ncbi:MAG: SAM-dependent methyltransferase [Candidatus Gottesmanbacteria bacterium GW2011_GWB1_43_11]|uniref:SAM-dependent methyltransferase n=1 Tax=Candidatus Gottesmanbacteria bacterium GW2011_GWB1_43_11 TaxID=1618446 RepID=A0A0G1CNN2_9BACT|nr:MAG: SAM-dependent methyltransferase [Candidatus Gottesmanbacteria bacterium GW2011_GWA2_42_16]KKS56115.1 MAG: SAM-dependent methyltransferase [Candidatus Gottesmanbacteria bacterium GW2011_GWA1_42_26]KKS87159.1 MAG: SAM-dependent methyltransferase [Candidatus Gottesmanbacteria bacterium GW2011_GWB1_43_11]OGG08519.1 MAG: hypothetical protein A2699_05505 [Candidatus Gottesmanbacteria bacterium RIFCSPHIGHO2_01_FULL_43_15]HCM37131.1 hypothetical protein [Patescibacteria group bacterium]
MTKSNLFYQNYDLLFQSKDYTREVNQILNIYRRKNQKTPRRVLDLGCGTGNHTRELAKIVPHVTGLDIDPLMVKLAKIKLQPFAKRASIINLPIEKLPLKFKFDLTVALFNVINYISTWPELVSFFRGVKTHLTSQGIFLFDAWNGVAALTDPPRAKSWVVKTKLKTIICHLTASSDLWEQKTSLTYDLEVRTNGKRKQDKYLLLQTLWTPFEIRSALNFAGLKLLFCSPLGQPQKRATAKDWKIFFGCQR